MTLIGYDLDPITIFRFDHPVGSFLVPSSVFIGPFFGGYVRPITPYPALVRPVRPILPCYALFRPILKRLRLF